MNPMRAEQLLSASEELATPLAVVDEATVERNVVRMAALAEEAGVRLRPHAKTHKSIWVGRLQMEHGASGLTVATLREAEALADAGIQDILLAHPPVGSQKLYRLARLAERVQRLAVVVDAVDVARRLPRSVEILWEVDSGVHRLGTAPGRPTVEAVLQLVSELGPERLRGLATYGGHVYQARTTEERLSAAEREANSLRGTAEACGEAGVPITEVSTGSTPTAAYVSRFPWITEIRPGTYVFGDANQVALGAQSLEDCALGVVTTIVGKHKDRLVIDAGSKALSTDLNAPDTKGFGTVVGYPTLCLARLSEEHGILSTESAPVPLKLGDRVVVIPNHAGTTVNLYDFLLRVSAGGVPGREPLIRGWQEAQPSGRPRDDEGALWAVRRLHSRSGEEKP